MAHGVKRITVKILVTNSHPDRSEAQIYTSLHNAGFEINVICAPDAVRLQQLEDSGIRVMQMAFNARMDFFALRKLRSTLSATSYDIIHAFNKQFLNHVLIASRGIPSRIVAYRGVIGNLSPWNPETRLTFMNRRVCKIVCVCDAVRRYMLSIGIPASRLITVLKGHDLTWYQSMQRAELSRFSIPPDAFVVGCAARMRPRKGIHVLVRSAKDLANRPVHFLLVGEARDRKAASYINASNLSRTVHMLGFRNDASSIMGACDAFIMPSLRREGLPRAVIEAMAQGVPAIVTNVGGMPEIVDHNRNGLIVPPNDPGAITRAIEYLADDPVRRATMGKEARTKIETCFNIERTIEKTMELYKEVMTDEGPHSS